MRKRGRAAPCDLAIERARAKSQIHGKKAVEENRAVGDAGANLSAGAQRIIKFENHRVSTVGVRAAIAELSLISKGRGALGRSLLMNAGKQCQKGVEIL